MKMFILPLILVGFLSSVAESAKSDYFIVYFGAEWCGSCQKMKRSWTDRKVKNLVKQYRNSKVYKIDVDERPDYAVKYRVTSIPTVILMDKNGNAIRRAVGYMSAIQLRDFLNNTPTRAGPQQKEEVFAFGAISILKNIILILARLALFLLG